MQTFPASLALVSLLAVLPASAHDVDLTTEDYLEQPELFQVATLAGALAILRQLPELASSPEDFDCFGRWTVHEDVLAIVADHADRNPLARHEPFAVLLVTALRERCAGGS